MVVGHCSGYVHCVEGLKWGGVVMWQQMGMLDGLRWLQISLGEYRWLQVTVVGTYVAWGLKWGGMVVTWQEMGTFRWVQMDSGGRSSTFQWAGQVFEVGSNGAW